MNQFYFVLKIFLKVRIFFQNFKQDQSLDQLIQPFISMVTNPDLPYGAKMGMNLT